MKYITKMKLLFDSKMLAWREAGKEIRKEIRKGAFDMVFEEDDYKENISTVIPFLRHLFFL